MTRISDELESLSRQIVDQHEVDWARVSLRARTQESGTIQGLQMLDEIIHGFRHAQVGGAETAEPRRNALFRFAGLDVLESVGRGAYGEVFLAYDPILDLKVALKLRHADSDALAHQFIAEARRQARIRHPHVASIFGAALDGHRVGIWMEHVRGESLAQRVQRGPLLLEEIVSIGLDLCAALQTVHQHGLVHGDVKAENVLCETGGRIVLADFGCAGELEAEPAGGIVSGTLRDLAPEVLQGGPRSEASDIYALGVLLYRLIGGRYPFNGEILADFLAAHAAPPPPLASLNAKAPAELCRIVHRCLNTDPQQRPSSARELASALGKALTPSSWRRNTLVIALAGCTLLAAVAIWVATPRGAAPTWQNEITLYRIVDGKSQPIRSGGHVGIGDGLQLAYASDQQTWLYVLDDDGRGNTAVLFPAPQLTPFNPLPPNQHVTLPNAGNVQLSWTIGDDNPHEEMLVVASRTAQPALERAIADWTHASRAPDDNLKARSATALRRAAAPDAVESAQLRAALAEVEKAGTNDVHYWRFELPHDSL